MDSLSDALDLVTGGIESAFDAAGRYLLAVIEALIVLLLARIVLGYLRGSTQRLLARTDAPPYARAVVQQVLSVSTYFLALSIVLAIFGASWAGVLTFFTVTSIAIALSIQDVLKNLIAGFYILLERPFGPGEKIRLKEITGSVEHVSLRTTRLRSADDEQVIVPNAVLFSEIVHAPPQPDAERLRVDLAGIPGNPSDIAPAVRAALAGAPGLRSPGPRIQFRRLAETGADIRVAIWHDPADDVVATALQRLRDRFPSSEISLVDG